MQPDCVKSPDDEPCKAYQIVRAYVDIERECQAKLIVERDKWFNEAQKLGKFLREKDEAMGVLFKRLDAAGVDYSDLIS